MTLTYSLYKYNGTEGGDEEMLESGARGYRKLFQLPYLSSAGVRRTFPFALVLHPTPLITHQPHLDFMLLKWGWALSKIEGEAAFACRRSSIYLEGGGKSLIAQSWDLVIMSNDDQLWGRQYVCTCVPGGSVIP